jgi:RimJ/RimL family protein N-acetyltransferase
VARSPHDPADLYTSIQDRNSDTYWVIETAGELAGVAFLHSLNEADRKARFAIGMLAPNYLGRGLGAESSILVLSHAFRDLGLHRVDLRVLAFNTGAMTVYPRCGFVVEGRESDSCWLEGRWYDDIIMGLLEREFRADHKRALSRRGRRP